jgi:hypothetical protein
MLDVPAVIRGKVGESKPSEEETFTVVVNADEALIVLAASVGSGQKLVMVNGGTKEEREVQVAHRGPVHAGMNMVVIEFMRPAREFWHVSSPPESWRTLRA